MGALAKTISSFTLIREHFRVSKLIVDRPKIQGINGALVLQKPGAAIGKGVIGTSTCCFVVPISARLLCSRMPASFDLVDVIPRAFRKVHIKVVMVIAHSDL